MMVPGGEMGGSAGPISVSLSLGFLTLGTPGLFLPGPPLLIIHNFRRALRAQNSCGMLEQILWTDRLELDKMYLAFPAGGQIAVIIAQQLLFAEIFRMNTSIFCYRKVLTSEVDVASEESEAGGAPLLLTGCRRLSMVSGC